MADRLFIPSRSDIWLAHFGHLLTDANGLVSYTRHREHGGKRPCVVLSNDDFHRSAAELVIVAPITSHDTRMSTRVPIRPPEGGLRVVSYVICEGVRSIGRQFLIQKWGQVQDGTLLEVELVLRKLMGFKISASEDF